MKHHPDPDSISQEQKIDDQIVVRSDALVSVNKSAGNANVHQKGFFDKSAKSTPALQQFGNTIAYLPDQQASKRLNKMFDQQWKQSRDLREQGIALDNYEDKPMSSELPNST